MMKKVLALALVGLMASTASATWVSIVALDGPNAYQGGMPSLTNGSVDVNFLGAGTPPQAGGAGIVISGPSATARIGVVVELVSDSIAPNHIDTSNTFFTTYGGTDDAVNIAAVQNTAINDLGDPWFKAIYAAGTAMNAWQAGGYLPYGPSIEDWHVLAGDQILIGGEGGNSADGPNPIFMIQDITLHGVLGADDGSVYTMLGFDFQKMEIFDDVSIQTYQSNVNAEPILGHVGNWFARNGRALKTAFPVVVLPEPGCLSLLALGGLALIRRRK